jgi:hypothetical protein
MRKVKKSTAARNVLLAAVLAGTFLPTSLPPAAHHPPDVSSLLLVEMVSRFDDTPPVSLLLHAEE